MKARPMLPSPKIAPACPESTAFLLAERSGHPASVPGKGVIRQCRPLLSNP
jgi:hypothetical protein